MTQTPRRIALLIVQVMPYFAHTYEEIAARVGRLRIMPSVVLEPDRPWQPHWRSLDVKVQRTVTVSGVHRHPKFDAKKHIQISYDVLYNLIRFGPDVVISLELGSRTLQAVLWRMIRVPGRRKLLFVWVRESTHMAVNRGRARMLLRRLIFRKADGIFVNGEDGRAYVHTFGFADRRIFVWPSVVPVEPFLEQAERRSPAVHRRLIYIGQLIERKGLGPFLDVLGRWAGDHPERAVSMLVVGDGPLLAPLSATKTPPNLELEFAGAVDYTGVAPFYAQAGIFAFPTLGDEWGMVVNEALAAAMPVLGSVFSHAVLDLVEEGVTGWQFRSDDAESTYAALDRLFATTDDQLAEMRRASRERGAALTPAFAAEEVVRAIQTVWRETVPQRETVPAAS